MVFGASDIFAVEAELEPGPAFPPRVGRSAAGRVYVICHNVPLGDRDEPCSALGPIRDHLVEKCLATNLWHPQFGGHSASEQFATLDAIFFLGSDLSLTMYDAVAECNFLTNVSEVFDGVKAFLLRPPGDTFVVLARVREGNLLRFEVPVETYANAVTEFDQWLNHQQQRLSRADA